jgi:3-phosphoshikimate 1-carboxyvinyltransferase
LSYLAESVDLNISVANWPASGWQIDEQFPRVLARQMTAEVNQNGGRQSLSGVATGAGARLPQIAREAVISRARDLGDSIMTAIAIAPLALARHTQGPVRFTDLGRLRLQECERVTALRTELTRCGARVVEADDTLEVFPSVLHGAEIETYNDHRMAMCFAILGLKVRGIKIKNPSCVKKTFPNFFQKFAAAPPAGLGVTIRDARTARPLASEELFAD